MSSHEFTLPNYTSTEHFYPLISIGNKHTIMGLPVNEQSPVQAEAINPVPSGSMAKGSIRSPVSQFVSMPQTPGCSDEIGPARTDSFERVPESGNELCSSHQLEIRGRTRPNHYNVVDNSDSADAYTNVQPTSQNSLLLVQSGTRSSDDATTQNPNQRDKHCSASSNDTHSSLGFSRPQEDQVVESEIQRLGDSLSEGVATMDNARGRTRMPSPNEGSNKHRRRRAGEPADEGSDSDDEFMPARKLRKAGSRRRKPKRDISGPQARNRGKTSPASRDQNMDTAIISYKEWLLSDAVLKCIRDNGRMTLQVQFTYAPSPCGVHTEQPQQKIHSQPRDKDQPQKRAVKPKSRVMLDDSGALTSKQSVPGPPASPNDADDNADIYQMELLARWGKNIFFLRWHIDGSTGWEPWKNILDKEMLRNFESNYQGFDEGVNMLDTWETKQGKRQYLLHFHDRPATEDAWVDEELLSPNLIERFSQSGLDISTAL